VRVLFIAPVTIHEVVAVRRESKIIDAAVVGKRDWSRGLSQWVQQLESRATGVHPGICEPTNIACRRHVRGRLLGTGAVRRAPGYRALAFAPHVRVKHGD